jgi:hypothetical protein
LYRLENKYIGARKLLGIFRKHKQHESVSGDESGKLEVVSNPLVNNPPPCDKPLGPPIDDGIHDKILYCVTCDQPFVFAAGEQRYYAQKQISETKRCPACRAIRRKQRELEKAEMSIDEEGNCRGK